jgi:hypothetical protein
LTENSTDVFPGSTVKRVAAAVLCWLAVVLIAFSFRGCATNAAGEWCQATAKTRPAAATR